MIDDAVVVDAVIHAYNFSPENQKNPELCNQLGGMLYGLCSSYAPRTQPEYTLDVVRFMSVPDPDLIAHALFAESPTDFSAAVAFPVGAAISESVIRRRVAASLAGTPCTVIVASAADTSWRDSPNACAEDRIPVDIAAARSPRARSIPTPSNRRPRP